MISENIGREIREGWESFDPRERDPRAEELTDAAERLSANLAVTREWVKAATEGGPETGELLEDAYAAHNLIEKELAKVRADREVFRRSRRWSGLGLTQEQEEELSRLLIRSEALRDAYGVMRDALPESLGVTASRYVMMGVLWR